MSEQPSEAESEMTAHATPTDEPGDADTYDLTESDQDTSGDMGVSSEREGPTGPGQHGTTGVRDVSPLERDPDAEVLPEQAAGGPEKNPEGIAPKGGYPDDDPRSHGDTPDRPSAEREVDRRPQDD